MFPGFVQQQRKQVLGLNRCVLSVLNEFPFTVRPPVHKKAMTGSDHDLPDQGPLLPDQLLLLGVFLFHDVLPDVSRCCQIIPRNHKNRQGSTNPKSSENSPVFAIYSFIGAIYSVLSNTCPRRESNPDLRFRKPPFYPLNYGDI